MTDQTPVETATEAVSQPIPDINRLSHREIQQWLARTALASLAEHRDDIARVLGGKCISDAAAEAAADAVLAYLTGGAR